MMPSPYFKQRQKQHALTALRSVPRPIPGLEHIHFAAQVLPAMLPLADLVAAQPVAEAAPDGGMIVPEEETLSVTLHAGRAGNFRYSIHGLALPNMPVPIKISPA